MPFDPGCGNGALAVRPSALPERLLEQDAAAHGAPTVRLGTHSALTEAIALYRACGYRQIGAYSDSPYNQLAFEKVVRAQSPQSS